jgi:geranylgeranyl diphosphate synthase type II
MASDSLPARIDSLRERVNRTMRSRVEGRRPEELYRPVQHVLAGDGKRLRPIVVLLVAESLGSTVDRALPAALAVELFHNFTLVHDDIMDGADQRRGQPTVHVKWDVGTAILTGDLLMGLSYDLLGDLDEAVDLRAVHDVFDPMVERLCTGQTLDATYETRTDVTVDDYLEMIDGKTGALIGASFELGGVVAGASDAVRDGLARAGQAMGRAFQIQDDLLDVTADHEAWGKAVGGDLVAGKKTFVTLQALERAEGDTYAWMAERMRDGGGFAPGEVPDVRDHMDRLGVFDAAGEAVAEYTDTARRHLDVLPADRPARQALIDLIDRMEARSR